MTHLDMHQRLKNEHGKPARAKRLQAMLRRLQRALYFLAFLGLQGCAYIDEQWFFVSEASLQEERRHRELSEAFVAKGTAHLTYNTATFVVSGHRITSGEGFIIALRKYYQAAYIPPYFGMHQSGFDKATIFTPRSTLTPGAMIHIPDTDGTIAFFSGSSSFGGNGCFGYASQGTIQINGVSETQIDITVDIKFQVASPLGFVKECSGEKAVHVIKGTYVVPRLLLQELTPWQGVAGKTVYHEGHPD